MKKYEVSHETRQALSNRFSYHAPHGDQTERYEEIRAKVEELAAFIAERTPVSREQSVAYTHLDEVMFNANAAIARNEPGPAAQPEPPQPAE